MLPEVELVSIEQAVMVGLLSTILMVSVAVVALSDVLPLLVEKPSLVAEPAVLVVASSHALSS